MTGVQTCALPISYAKECFEFNKPYKCITVDYRKSSEVLPELDLTAKSIIWLDYDSKLDESILSDIDTVCAKACSGSMLIVTLNIHPDRPASERKNKKMGILNKQVSNIMLTIMHYMNLDKDLVMLFLMK